MSIVRLAFISDPHGKLPSPSLFEKVDRIVCSGDICPDIPSSSRMGASLSHEGQGDWLYHTFRPWANSVPEIVATWGNHDFIGEFGGAEILRSAVPHCTLLVGQHARLNGINFFGTPYIPNCSGWAFSNDKKKRLSTLMRMPKSTDILISHGPPYGLLDRTRGNIKAGCKHLTRLLNARERRLIVACGHIHEAFGSRQYNQHTIINASLVNEHYKPVNSPYFMTIDTEELNKWNSTTKTCESFSG